ncbi:PREDICTED: solute carrier family 25 member 43 [Thamnophis sirtalis]|uniref:Solute carrier family 25 member 43 n=1 Tax=Thamnophis sirtalis TaxID=35019 RepID=A0A6I9YDI6_9SAUR|nr:PREDICTED: solute carrier family 25 member 43 [Thamnophis sirtalis]
MVRHGHLEARRTADCAAAVGLRRAGRGGEPQLDGPAGGAYRAGPGRGSARAEKRPLASRPQPVPGRGTGRALERQPDRLLAPPALQRRAARLLPPAQSSHLPCSGGVDVRFSGVIDCFKQTVKTKGVLALWNGLTANLLRIVPYFGIMFSTFEFCKRVCLYWNGYTDSPLRYALTPGVDQSLRPQELQDVKLLGRRNF